VFGCFGHHCFIIVLEPKERSLFNCLEIEIRLIAVQSYYHLFMGQFGYRD